jgi:hypothetical protein
VAVDAVDRAQERGNILSGVRQEGGESEERGQGTAKTCAKGGTKGGTQKLPSRNPGISTRMVQGQRLHPHFANPRKVEALLGNDTGKPVGQGSRASLPLPSEAAHPALFSTARMKRLVDAQERSTFDASTVAVEQAEIRVANTALNWPRREGEGGRKEGSMRGDKRRQKSHYKARVLPMQLDRGWLETMTQCAPDLHDASLDVLLAGRVGAGRRSPGGHTASLAAQPVVRSVHSRYCPPAL